MNTIKSDVALTSSYIFFKLESQMGPRPAKGSKRLAWNRIYWSTINKAKRAGFYAGGTRGGNCPTELNQL